MYQRRSSDHGCSTYPASCTPSKNKAYEGNMQVTKPASRPYLIISWEVEVPQSEAPYPSSHLWYGRYQPCMAKICRPASSLWTLASFCSTWWTLGTSKSGELKRKDLSNLGPMCSCKSVDSAERKPCWSTALVTTVVYCSSMERGLKRIGQHILHLHVLLSRIMFTISIYFMLFCFMISIWVLFVLVSMWVALICINIIYNIISLDISVVSPCHRVQQQSSVDASNILALQEVVLRIWVSKGGSPRGSRDIGISSKVGTEDSPMDGQSTSSLWAKSIPQINLFPTEIRVCVRAYFWKRVHIVPISSWCNTWKYYLPMWGILHSLLKPTM